MEVKQKVLTPLKMVKDVIESKQKDGNYLHAKNLRFHTHLEESSGGFTVEKGNALNLTLPEVTMDQLGTSLKYSYNGKQKALPYRKKNGVATEIEQDFANGRRSNEKQLQVIIGNSISRDGMLLFSTDGLGFDCVWYVADTEGVKDVELKYCRNMGFSLDNPIKSISNYENARIDKTYWIDGLNQQRSINISDPDLINTDLNVLDMVGNFDLSQPAIGDIVSGGSHTSGMIQYAYNLYRLNGSQTKLSPLSELTSLDKGDFGGGAVNEVVSKTVEVIMAGLDTSYTNIKLYAIKYTSFNQAPSISVIMDQGISASGLSTHYDDGSILLGISNETFLFLGGEVLVPNEMAVKTNRMFLSNYIEKSYELFNEAGVDVADGCRSFSYDSLGNCTIADEMKASPKVEGIESVQIPVETRSFNKLNILNPGPTFSCINVDYNKYIYNKDNEIGGSGQFLKYTLTRSRINDTGFSSFSDEDADGRFFKDGELYRISIQFYSKYGEVSTPKWIADFVTQQTSQGNLSGFYATLKIELLPAFIAWLQSVPANRRPIGYKILRAERKTSDRTIIAQGILNGMICVGIANRGDIRPVSESPEAKTFCHTYIKIPSLMRNFEGDLCPMLAAKTYSKISGVQHPQGNANFNSDDYIGGTSEIFSSKSSFDFRKLAYQFNTMMQFNCPDIEFSLLNKISSNNMTVIGSLANSSNQWWGKETHIASKAVTTEIKTINCISPFDKKANLSGNRKVLLGVASNIQDHGLVGPTGSDNHFDSNQFYREYNGNFTFNKKRYDIYGEPEISERGQAKRTYRKNADLGYANTIEAMAGDSGKEMVAIKKEGVYKVDSLSCKSAFVVLGQENQKTETRPTLESIFQEMGFVDKKAVLMAEFRISDLLIYVGGLYGGNTYEDKKRTNYIEIGPYKKIAETSVFIKNPGDTFVAKYKFERISRKSLETSDQTISYITEIVSFTTETTVNVKNRNDLSIADWDEKFMPEYDSYAKYNRVYSQEPNLIYRKGNDYNFRAVTSFETSLIATKQKLPNEPIDSWTDILVNEQMDLDGRYGSINSVVSFQDEIYVFQDRAIAKLSILPRVQVAGGDGIAVQLGTGQLFNEYKYITTTSGCINKWGTCVGERGIYYLDAMNKSLCIVSGMETKNISDAEGFHKEFQLVINTAQVTKDNPTKKTGVSMGFDQITKDVYVSIYDAGKCTTLAYNEKSDGFTSYYSYDSPMYIFNKKEMLTVSPFNGAWVYKHFDGEYNTFYGKKEKSAYAVVIAPEPMVECIFNNIEYNSLAKNKSGKEVLNTWETVQVSNEFQNSGVVTLIDRDNIRKKNRQYRITLPRQSGSRDRIRNNWAVMELKMTNEAGNSIRMNDIVLYYSPNYIVVR